MQPFRCRERGRLVQAASFARMALPSSGFAERTAARFVQSEPAMNVFSTTRQFRKPANHGRLRVPLRLLALLAASLPAARAKAAPRQMATALEAHRPAVREHKETLRAEPAKAEQAYLTGARLVQQHNLENAQKSFELAVNLDPARQDYQLALNLTRQRRVSELIERAAAARVAGLPAQADALLAQARIIDPTSERLKQHQPEPTAEDRRRSQGDLGFAPPLTLAATPGRQVVDARGDIRQVVTQVSTQFGIRSVFDESVSAQQIRFNLGPASFQRAMPALLQMGHLLAVPLDTRTQFVVKDTPENRIRYVRQVQETIYIPASTAEQLNELVNIVKNIFDVKSVIASQASGTLAIRAAESTIAPLNYTLANLVDAQADVDLELKLFSVDRSRTINTGVQTPTSLGAFSVAAEAQSLVSANQATITQAIAAGALTLTGNATTDLLQEAAFLILGGFATDARLSNLVAIFGHGLTLFGVNLGSNTTLNLALNTSDARALDDLTVRLGNHQPTTLRVGEKFPITSSTYSSGISGSTASLLQGKTINGVSADQLLAQLGGAGASAVTPIITFEDLGITLKATPTVLKSDMVALHVDMKIEALTGASLDNIPVLASRAFVSDILLEDGKTAVLLSNLSRTETASINGIPGLADLPGFQETAADRLGEASSSELVVLLTPHLVHRRSRVIASRVVPFTPSAPQEF